MNTNENKVVTLLNGYIVKKQYNNVTISERFSER